VTPERWQQVKFVLASALERGPEERSRFLTACSLPRLFNGTVERSKGCTIRRIREATIESDQPMRYHVDGEPVQGGVTLRSRVNVPKAGASNR